MKPNLADLQKALKNRPAIATAKSDDNIELIKWFQDFEAKFNAFQKELHDELQHQQIFFRGVYDTLKEILGESNAHDKKGNG
jgi:uncharacterized protein YeaO (DUF488 family)